MGRRVTHRKRQPSDYPPVPDPRVRISARTAIVGLGVGVLVAAGLYFWIRSGNAPERSNVPTAGVGIRAEYVDPATCGGCHQEIWASFRKTGMGRSFQRLRPEARDGIAGPAEPFHHEPSNRYYSHVQRDGRLYQRRFQKNAQGRIVNILEKEIHYIMGSGNHARTFLSRSPSGKLVQLPLGWYSEGGGRWAMSPGYDRPNHDGFQRVITFDCMFCHNGFPQVGAGKDHPGQRPLFPSTLPEGIGCQRCHGPGSAHVEAASSGDGPVAAVISSIVNPSRLSAERQREVCFQCHLETTSRPLPNVVHRYGRGYFSFRPGEPLSDYAIYFDHAPGAGWDEKFEINHSAYRLMQSRCFLESARAITCTTCHDPHEPSGTRDAARRYNAACRTCHQAELAGLVSDGTHVPESECSTCHMPRRRTDDVVHAVMTDHRIQASPPRGLLEPKRERSTNVETAYRGEVQLYYPRSITDPGSEIYEAIAQTAQGSNLMAGIQRLEAAINSRQPEEAGFYFDLADALERDGRLERAAQWFEQALTRDQGFVLAAIRLGSVLSRAGRHGYADEVLRKAAALDPADPRVPKERGLNFARQGLYSEAVDASRSGIALDPDLPELHNNLGGALARLDRLDEATGALREAIRLQPDLAEARFNLGVLLASQGDLTGAAEEWREAIRGDPDFVAARYNIAALLARDGDAEAALAHLDAVLKADPEFEPARELRDQVLGIAWRATP